jgi:hypothetical protein
MTGVLTAQIFRLQRVANPDPHFGFYVIGRPLSILFMSMGIVVVLVGALRCWKLQNALVRGKAQAGGWEVLLVMGLSILVSGLGDAYKLWNSVTNYCVASHCNVRIGTRRQYREGHKARLDMQRFHHVVFFTSLPNYLKNLHTFFCSTSKIIHHRRL